MTTTSGQDVTIKADWTTSDASTARTTHSGLVTAIATGTVTLTASYQTSLASTTVVIKPSILSSSAIAACGTIAAPGSYFLDADLSQVSAAGPCLTITVGGVQIDCRSHMVSGVTVSGASSVTVDNCAVAGSLNSGIIVRDSNSVTLDHDSASFFELVRGHDNAVLDCTIDGGFTDSGVANGGDDGIQLIDQTSDRIQGNTIQNVFDAGIEGDDVVANTMIANNTIINAADAGIASYWCTSWTGDTISGNTVSRSSTLMNFTYKVGNLLCFDPSTPGAFMNNRMIGNTLRDPIPVGVPGTMWFDLANVASAVSNNLIQGNDMGSAPGPYTVPASGFVNGGGNICASPNPFCGGS